MNDKPRLLDFRDADGEPVQPYYAAFMLAHGLERKLVGPQWPFMEWIQRMWRESGVSREPPDHEGFRAWLEEQVRA